jgi:hypothetical protein
MAADIAGAAGNQNIHIKILHANCFSLFYSTGTGNAIEKARDKIKFRFIALLDHAAHPIPSPEGCCRAQRILK